MRALTLWQPHATLMSLVRPEPNPRRVAEKVFETRPQWARRVPLGPLVIHAAKSAADLSYVKDAACRDVWRRHYLLGIRFGGLLPLGAAVAVVDVVAVWESTGGAKAGFDLLRCAGDPANVCYPLHAEAYTFGDFSPGRILLQCENVQPLAKPVPMRGYQQIWTLTPEQVEQVKGQIGAASEVAP
jgi:hypothetical protein